MSLNLGGTQITDAEMAALASDLTDVAELELVQSDHRRWNGRARTTGLDFAEFNSLPPRGNDLTRTTDLNGVAGLK